MFVATLAGVFKYADLPEKYGPFVQYKASIDDKTINENDDIASNIIDFIMDNYYYFIGLSAIIIFKQLKKN